MTELRVVLPDDIANRLASEAAESGTTPEDLAAELLGQHARRQPAGGLGFVAIGRAKPGFSAKLAEEQLEAEGFA